MILSLLVAILLVFVIIIAIVASYLLYMSSRHGELQKLGFVGPKPRLFTGTQLGNVFENQCEIYQAYKPHKVCAVYTLRFPGIMITSLDVAKDVLGKYFNYFSDHRHLPDTGCCLDESLLVLKGERWKHVRKTVSPFFSTTKLRYMCGLLEKKSQSLMEVLMEKQESGEAVETKTLMSAFTMDAIASTAFGADINSTRDPENEFVKNAKKLTDQFFRFFSLVFLFPFLGHLQKAVKFSFVNKDLINFFVNFVGRALELRQSEVQERKRQDFIQVILDAEKENTVKDNEEKQKSGLSVAEVQGAALIFLLGGYETVSTTLSFTLFQIAMNPEVLKKVQKELDQKLNGNFPNYTNIQSLTYLDMCISETLRMYPPGYLLERQCLETVDIQGITFPKGYAVIVPVWAMHHDPDIWPMPEKFDPERFTPENKASLHPCAYLPFGMGPRNCIGMRLAQLEIKIALAAILQRLTPVSCDKSVYPIEVHKYKMFAEQGLWLKFEKRT
ncbi:cytochrome P450 3A41 [Aplysia californica]|uniref:Cytochrome P450 3A41 n=1 Tax=Aplysia californica TaxID=6500 RepID=A0ABM1A8W0_APLCA|nr:cytochrome P450 3A41 [Aplysia californica]